MKLFARLQKSFDCWFLLGNSFLFFLLRLPSLFEPYWYGDEGIYQVLGNGMRAGRLLYRDIWDNKPPLLYVFYALFGSDQFTIRFMSLIFGILSVLVFFFLARMLFKEKTTIYGTTVLFTFLFATPLFEGNIANAENFMMLPILSAGLLTLKWAGKQKEKTLFSIGGLLSLAFLFKAVALFDFAAFGIFLFFVMHKAQNRALSTIRLFVPLISTFFIPILFIMVFFLISGAFGDFFNAAFRQNIGYVGYGNSFIVAQGFLYIKIILLALIMFYLFKKRHMFSQGQLFIIIWFCFSLFNAYFSQRPYTHYLLVLLPSLVLFAGMVFAKSKDKVDIAAKQKISLTGKILLLVILILLARNFWIYSKLPAYYLNFIEFISGNKSVFAYQKFFDAKTPWDYELANYLKAHMKEKDTLFIWGNNAQVYTLTNTLPPGRYTVAYHMLSSTKTIQETIVALQKTQPRFIVVMTGEPAMPYSFPQYVQKFVINRAIIYEHISTR